MMRNIIAAMVVFAGLGAVVSVGATAQDLPPKCVKGFEFCTGYNYRLVAGTRCAPDYPTCEACSQPSNACIPPNAAAETCPGCNGPSAGQPINLSTGNTYITESDISIPGLGGGLNLARTWNSMLPALQGSYAFIFGTNWRSTYEERLISNSSDGYLKYARADGSVWSFGLLSLGSTTTYQTAAPANAMATITGINTDTNLVLTFKSGEKRWFNNTSGLLTSIIDRNGNATQLSYDSSSRLAAVTDPAGRHLYFNYPSGSATLVSSVTSDLGVTLSYSYDAQGRLTQVTKPDNTTISFAYDASSRITTVTDSNGKILESHTYDVLGRGLTSSRANGVDAVSVTYPQ